MCYTRGMNPEQEKDMLFALFQFPYLPDPRFINSAAREEILALKLSELTIANAKRAIDDLNIRKKVTVITKIPDENERRFIIPSLGIGGRSVEHATVLLFFDPNHPKVIQNLRQWRPSEIAHELNHEARRQRGKFGHTLLDAMINEGLATYYQEQWDEDSPKTPWGNALFANQQKEEWEKAQPVLREPLTEKLWTEWFFGANKLHSVWTGYSLGAAIVRAYFQHHPQAKMRDIVGMKSEDILKQSGY